MRVVTRYGGLLAFLAALAAGAASAVELPQPSIEERVESADLAIVADGIELLPRTSTELDKFYRVQARVAGVLKGDAQIGDRVEIVVDNTISELRNNCCTPGRIYVLFLRRWAGKYVFVGSPLGAVPVEPDPDLTERRHEPQGIP